MAYSRQTHKRTVHCSYCRNPGHNKSSCPELAARVESIRQSHGDDHYDVRRFDAKKAKRKAKAKERACGYCSSKGHNRATCPELRANILKSQAKNAEYRKAIYERMKAFGVGVGAILSTDRFMGRVNPGDYDSARYRIPHVITLINWDNIAHFNRDYTYFDQNAPWVSKPLCDLNNQHMYEPGWIWDVEIVQMLMGEDVAQQWIDGSHWRADQKMTYFCDVECPVPTNEPPAKWLLGGDLKYWKRAYKRRSSYYGVL